MTKNSFYLAIHCHILYSDDCCCLLVALRLWLLYKRMNRDTYDDANAEAAVDHGEWI